MNSHEIVERLAHQADQLAAGLWDEAEQLLVSIPQEADEELRHLLALAHQVAILLRVRHSPDAAWRDELKRDLLAEHHQQQVLQARWLVGRTWAVRVGVGVAFASLLVYWRQQTPPIAE